VLQTFSTLFIARQWIVLSALAEGADCMVAEKAIQHLGASLEVRLPLSQPIYECSFSGSQAVHRFRRLLSRAILVSQEEPQSDPEQAYLAAGKYILDHCDLLVAVWDGNAAQGRGGTGEIVQLAREYGRPLAWIKAGNRQPGTLVPIDLGIKQGCVVYERLDERGGENATPEFNP
jgi:hypothetical protein